ncbi:Hypp605 [Branchiostoma lanceolatum]|uniref:Hypp605 protein n=1 Tax=Branchiostoma lanceolatum TaxID=7740 RepID=A0A8J9VCD0_BRALA|nr:Hypp605 [Branchiostoma lanceolatum]
MEWVRRVGRQSEANKNKIWVPNEDSRICSVHFVDGEPTEANPYPTEHMNTPSQPYSSTPKPRKKPTPRPFTEKSTSKKGIVEKSTVANDESVASDSSYPTEISFQDHDYVVPQSCETCEDCSAKDAQIRRLKQMNTKLKLEAASLKVQRSQRQFSYDNLKDDSKVQFYTGLPNRQAFDALYTYMAPNLKKIRFWRGTSALKRGIRRFISTPKKFGPDTKLSGKDLLVMTLMKLKLGLLNEDLADRFGVSTTTCSRSLTATLKLLASELKCLIFTPSEEVQRANLPRRFQNARYRKVRHIIDCTEFFIETPRNLQVKAQTWSNYKHHQTIKCLVSITPTGHFNFVSDTWGGRISDRDLTQRSGFLEILSRDDKVLADRGFPIEEDVAQQYAHLLIPPGKRGSQQMTGEQVTKTKEIANRRIFVEQAIRRLKTFRILKYELPITMLHQVDEMIQVCAALCNLQKPLVKY